MAEKKYVYSFKEAHAAKVGKEILGGKGFGLAEMTAAGINSVAARKKRTIIFYFAAGGKSRISLQFPLVILCFP